MPPPSFSHPPAVVLSRTVQSWLKDLSQKIRSALSATDEAKRHSILSCIDTAVQEQHRSLQTAAQADDANHPTAAGPSPTAQIKSQIALRINDSLSNLFQGEFASQQQSKRPAVVDVLFVLMPLLGPAFIVTEWWDHVLHPLLKNDAIQNVTANRARELVVKAMTSAPTTAYEDEPAPVAVWPSPLPAGSATSPGPRRPREAPYPMSAAAPASPSRPLARSSSIQPGSGSASRSASVGSRQDMFRRFTQQIFDLYLTEAAQESEQGREHQEERRRNPTDVPVTAGVGDQPDATRIEAWGRRRNAQDFNPLVWKGNLESILLVYSNEKPKEFFHHVAESFNDAMARVPLLFLLSTFLRLYPIHAYHITATALPMKLMLSLQLDTSTTCVSLGVTALIMLIPHIPDWIASGGAGGLPTLLSIFARIVDWRRLGHGWENRVGDDPELQQLRRERDEEFAEVDRLGKRLNIKSGLRWHRLETSFDTAMSTPPNAEHLFTFLYGLFPCNVIRFLRSPIDYLKKASFDSPFEGPWEDMMDELAVQSRSAPILRRHTLHPSLVTMDAETELTDKQRWLNHDSADINAECLSLFLGKWHDVNPSHVQEAERQRKGSVIDHEGADDESISVMSDPRHATYDLSRRTSLAPTHNPTSPISSAHQKYHRLPDSVNPDEILLTYASLRSGAHLTPAASLPHIPTSSANVHRGDDSVASSVSRPTGMVMSATLPRLVPAASATAAATPTTATAVAHSSNGPPSSSSGGSPVTHVDRAISRSRSGSLSSVLSNMSPTSTSMPISPISTGHRHPLSTSHVPSEATTPHQEKGAFFSSGGQVSQGASGTDDGSAGLSSELAFLQRENLLIRNELNFELYLKEQHLRHIGRLHRDKVTDTALEAERQNLYHTVRALRNQIATLTTNLERQRAEAVSTKARHVQWEAELNNKLKAYREERKAWTNEARQLKAQAEENAATISSLSKQLEESGSKLFELQTKLEADEPKLAKIEQYEKKISQLTTCLAYWDNDVLKYERQRQEMEKLLNKWDEMAYLVESTESSMMELERKHQELEGERERLQKELEAASARIESLVEEKNRLALEGQANQEVVRILAATEAERDQLRGLNENLNSRILDLKAQLEVSQSRNPTSFGVERGDSPDGTIDAEPSTDKKLATAEDVNNDDGTFHHSSESAPHGTHHPSASSQNEDVPHVDLDSHPK